jgi:3-oxoadipate enol-lactonase
MFVTVNQIKMFYEDQGRGLPVVLLHGYPLDHTIWGEVVKRLSSQARLITPDLRGHGQTEAPPEVYTMRRMADDVAALMDQLEIQQAVLVGHSMGGYASLAFSLAYPDRLLGLGMVASQAAADNPERRVARYETALAVESDGVGSVAESMPGKLTNQPELAHRLHEMILATKPAGVAGTLRGIAERQDMRAWISSVGIPVAVIAGTEDVLISLERAKERARCFPKAQLTVVHKAGHMPMMEAPDEVTAALVELISDVRKSTCDDSEVLLDFRSQQEN